MRNDPETEMTIHLADYRDEREAFRTLLEPHGDKRILLFSGPSGCGKTTLVNVCLGEVSAGIPRIPIQLRGSTVNVAEIFSRAGHHLTWARLSHFAQRVAALQSPQVPQHIEIDGNWLLGINQHITVALNVEDVTDRYSRRVSLTDAWFRDLHAFQHPVLVALDTYEDAPTEVKDWISGPFLSRVATTAQLRVLIAGQQVPDPHNIEWGECCAAYELSGVTDPKEWWTVIEAMERRIPYDSPLVWLAGVCDALKGHPDPIMKLIGTLPQREGRV